MGTMKIQQQIPSVCRVLTTARTAPMDPPVYPALLLIIGNCSQETAYVKMGTITTDQTLAAKNAQTSVSHALVILYAPNATLPINSVH